MNFIHLRSPVNVEGYFQSLIKFVSYNNKDDTTFKYLQNVQQKIEKATFINKSFLYKILSACKSYSLESIRDTISNECGSRFSIIIDTATDIAISQQLCFIIRYASNDFNVYERVFTFLSVSNTCAQGILNFLKEKLLAYNLDIKNAVGSCTDGASNMAGLYSGFAGLMRKLNPRHIHTWCVAHRFNLVIEDAIKKCNLLSDMLASVNSFASFMRRSPKRIANWKEMVKILAKKYGDINERIMPQKSNATRWWSKFKCLKNTCKTISCLVAFLVNLKTLYISAKSRLTDPQKSEIEELHDIWTKDSQNIILAHSLQPILHELHKRHTRLQSFPLPISDMMAIVEESDEYLQKLEQDEEMTQMIDRGCAFSKDVLNRLLTEEVKKFLSDRGGDDSASIYNLDVSNQQKQLIKNEIAKFLKQLRMNLEKRFFKNFAMFKQYYSELRALSPFSVLRMPQNSQIQFLYMSEYNDFVQSEFELEFKLFANEFQEFSKEGEK